MALFPLHHEVPFKGEVLFDSNGLRRFSSGGSSNGLKHRTMAEATTLGRDCWMKSCKKPIPYCYSLRGKLCLVRASSENKVTKKRIQLLDSYFGKLRNEDDKPSISAGDDIDQKFETNADKELDSLSVYLDKLQKDAKSRGLVSSTLEVAKSEGGSLASKLRKTGIESNNNPFQQLDDDQSEDTLNFYVVSILASINVGVCLFEAAAPVRNNDMGLLSLPLLYGAKINDLIVAGEWWRLVTPMFLHSGIAHVALSSWALLTFGPKVCRDYGLLTFCLIYILGGVSGNFMSFLHTPDPTVGGTGPAFALIGAWLVDQNQNKEMIKSDEYEDLFQKAIIMTGLGLILSHFGPIDDWTNLGALIAGIVYGFFTCPVLQLGRGSERQEGTVTVGPEKEKNADPCKSFLVFTIFIAVLVTSVLLLGDGPLDFPTYDDVVYSLI
ncbi:PREDICTED: RHOMBOID-like protein 9, chloroplastic [Camelina sativa]|uniref:RHOMBOID-like protein 9, chloroplastic n=1 Tax=Camelina sativa TaxID=90675 RepID=A0ABM0U4N8_CAMSA|nr:PREDICTED: RHOMBOID-like protein 9, chloroplastic [Camelina sativa]XP_010435758.1 PREDICTED: RHOMBOID-like protein 9, chloroplastic [Camelina sativa]